MSNGTKVVKRDGHSEGLNLEKIHKMTEEACEGLAGVSASQVEIQSGLQFYDGITTAEIQEILVRSASDLIDLDSPNYQYVAARLLLYGLYKQVFGNSWRDGFPYILDHLKVGSEKGIYDSTLPNSYSADEWEKINSWIDHDRDVLFTYAGLRQVVDKYLVQDRSSNELYETPQYMYMLIAATIFQNYPIETRLNYVRRYYDAISKHRINIPTPIMAGVRTPLRQFASCVLVDIDDTLDSIFSSDMAIGKYVAQRAGIGINAGRIRGINSKIRGGEVQHTGVVPFLKKFESTVRCCTQNGIRGGSATVHFPIWHQEIRDIIVLKNNKGTEDNRVRKLDYSIQLSKLFYERFIQDQEISLFSPHDCPGLYESFGTDKFDDLYTRYENDDSIPRTTVGGQELILDLLKERAETGRIYLMNIDHCNEHSSFKDKVNMSNLCQEITLPTDPIDHIDDENGEIALCILSAINVGKLRNIEEMEELCDLSVRGLEELIDYQEYPVAAAEHATKSRRSLGVGYIGLAHYLAKLGYGYGDKEAWSAVHKLTEAFQYYLLKSSNKVAQEKGACGAFSRTKYADGILPIDTYKKDVDELVPNDLSFDWGSLREDILAHGLRHSTLSSQMPSESSSVVSNATNGIEPPRGYLSIKKSKKGPLKQIVPQYNTLKNNYTLLWDMPDNTGYINIVSVMQKFFDQGISGNWSYNPMNYKNNEVPVSVMANDFLTTYKYGWKTSYYQNTYDFKTDEIEEPAHPVGWHDNVEEVGIQGKSKLQSLMTELLNAEEETCEAVQSEIKGMTVFNPNKVDFKKQTMFFGQPLGVQRYDQYKYPVFDKLTQQQLGYFWRPEEVSLQKDRSDYATLRPEQKHIFTSNLKYQILLDSVQGRGPSMAFLPYCSLPELEACMEVWGFMEMIHSRSYTHIIKNVYPDPSEVFDTILDNDKIIERAQSVTKAYDEFIKYAQDYGQSNSWKPDWKDHINSEWTRKDLKRHLYRAVTNVNILEGIRFYVSFACTFAFGELKLMEGSAKIVSLIARDENQHLVLTQQILKKWRDGDDPEMMDIIKEEEDYVYDMFKKCVDEEKAWAEYLFKDGSMIGLNDKLLHQYVEWIANKRMKAIGLNPIYDIPLRNNPLPWTEHWISSKGLQVAPQETEVESYIVGGIKQDVKKDTFSGFKL